MKKLVIFYLLLCSGCATYPNTYIQDSTITTTNQGVGPQNVGYNAGYPSNPGSFLQWLVFGPPGGYYGGNYYYPPAWGGGGSFWYNGNNNWGRGCW
jgi:hypothetical protein